MSNKFTELLVQSIFKGSKYGCVSGCIIGGVTGYKECPRTRYPIYRKISIEDRLSDYFSKFSYTFSGILLGSLIGTGMGGLWPLSVSTLILSTFELQCRKKNIEDLQDKPK